jgi:hypothetical protein
LGARHYCKEKKELIAKAKESFLVAISLGHTYAMSFYLPLFEKTGD